MRVWANCAAKSLEKVYKSIKSNDSFNKSCMFSSPGAGTQEKVKSHPCDHVFCLLGRISNNRFVVIENASSSLCSLRAFFKFKFGSLPLTETAVIQEGRDRASHPYTALASMHLVISRFGDAVVFSDSSRLYQEAWRVEIGGRGVS